MSFCITQKLNSNWRLIFNWSNSLGSATRFSLAVKTNRKTQRRSREKSRFGFSWQSANGGDCKKPRGHQCLLSFTFPSRSHVLCRVPGAGRLAIATGSPAHACPPFPFSDQDRLCPAVLQALPWQVTQRLLPQPVCGRLHRAAGERLPGKTLGPRPHGQASHVGGVSGPRFGGAPRA